MDNTTSRGSVMGAFINNPANVRFDSQLAGETVILILRAHPITQIGWIINSFFIVILVIVLNFVLPIILTPGQILFFNFFGIAAAFAYIWYNFLLWFFNVGIITNMRVIDIDFKSILYKEVTAARIDRIEEVTTHGAGYFGSLFDYGNLYVQTASSEVDIEFERIPHPSLAVEIINNLEPPVT
jgi:hypothetical protein